MSTQKISRWLLWRELLNGELLLIFLALWLAISFSSGIAIFTDRLHKGLTSQSAELLGGDLIIKSSRPLPAAWRDQAMQAGLDVSESVEFSSMAIAGDAMQLVSVKAVDAHYPLRGDIALLELGPNTQIKREKMAPASGEIWVDKKLWSLLELDKSANISLGNADFRVSQQIESEPDRGADFINFSPRVLINLQDLVATQLISAGSRVSWKLALAGNEASILEYADWIKPKLSPHEQLIGVNNQRPVVQNTLIQAEKYLYLSGLLAVILAGVAIGFSMRRYTQRQTDSIALLKSLGANSQKLIAILVQKFLLLSLIALVLGIATGTAIQHLIIDLLKSRLPNELPLPGSRPFWLACATAVLMIAGFALPPLAQLIRTPAMRILKQSLPPLGQTQVILYGGAFFALWALMVIYSRDLLLGSVVFFGITTLFIVLALLSMLIVRLSGSRLRQWLFRYPSSTLAQTTGFSVTLWVILCIYFLRTEMIENWKQVLPENAPNYFAINIQPSQKDGFAAQLKQNNFQAEAIYPVIRGRLTHINGIAINANTESEEVQSEGRDESLNRELNLTWASELPTDNKIVEGHWWPGQLAENQLAISVEQKFAKRLKIALGDQLQFSVADKTVTAAVTSLRTVKWESMRPNFYVIFEPGQLDNFPAFYMTSFFAAENAKPQLMQMAKEFSGVSLIDVDGIMSQIRKITSQVGTAIESVMASILLMGVVLLYSSILISLDERSQESALVRAFGGSKAKVSLRVARELFANGLLAGLLAVGAAELSLYALSELVFGLAYRPHPLFLVLVPLGAASIVTLTGAWAAWWLGRVPLSLLLKEASQ